jgi:hypothetical protein
MRRFETIFWLKKTKKELWQAPNHRIQTKKNTVPGRQQFFLYFVCKMLFSMADTLDRIQGASSSHVLWK